MYCAVLVFRSIFVDGMGSKGRELIYYESIYAIEYIFYGLHLDGEHHKGYVFIWEEHSGFRSVYLSVKIAKENNFIYFPFQ